MMPLAKRISTLIDTNHGTFRGLIRVLFGQVEFITGRIKIFTEFQPALVHRLVFVCQGNINRSAYASCVASSLGVKSISIGLSTCTGTPAFESAVETALLYGHCLQGHSATDFSDYQYAPGDLILAMEIRHARDLLRRGIPSESVILLGNWSHPHHIHIHDPHELSKQYYRSCFSILNSAVFNLVNELRRANSPICKS